MKKYLGNADLQIIVASYYQYEGEHLPVVLKH